MELDTQYLVTPGEDTDIAVSVCGRACEQGGTLFFLTSDEAAIRFPTGADSAVFSLGQPVTVSLTSARLGDTIRLPGVVKFRRDEDRQRIFRIPFNFENDENGNLRRRLGKLNRRKEMRVPAENPADIGVEMRPVILDDNGVAIEDSPHAWQGSGMEVADISFHGMAITAGFETDLVLAETTLVEIRMAFPDPIPPAVIVGFLRNRTLDGSLVRYGVEVTGQHTRDYLRHEDTIAQYVWQRMRELFGMQA